MYKSFLRRACYYLFYAICRGDIESIFIKIIFKYFFYLLIGFHKISTCEDINIYICRQSGKDYYLGLGIAGPSHN